MEINIIVCAGFILLWALIAFFKTPADKRYLIFSKEYSEDLGSEFAPMYSKKERIKILLMHFSWVIPLLLFSEFVLVPWFVGYVKTANEQLIGIGELTGFDLVLYGLFVGFPMLIFFVICVISGKSALAYIRLKQFPLPEKKVFSKTKYVYGFRASIRGYGILLCLMMLLALAIWGFFQVEKILY